MNNPGSNASRRRLLGLGAAALTIPYWAKPVVSTVVLPAHAQTSICVTDMTVGGPLAGNASGASNCTQACEDEAASLGAQLCAVRETTVMGNIECSCDVDTM